MKQNMLAILHGVSEIMTAMRSLTRSEIQQVWLEEMN